MLKQKATELASAKDTDFTPSAGWLSRWNTQHNIVFKKEQGEKQSADVVGASDWQKDILPEVLQKFHSDDIFNADETGLYYHGIPDKGFCLKGQDLLGGKKALDRKTVLLCSSMSGSEKLPPLVIGKVSNHAVFPNIWIIHLLTTTEVRMLG